MAGGTPKLDLIRVPAVVCGRPLPIPTSHTLAGSSALLYWMVAPTVYLYNTTVGSLGGAHLGKRFR